MDVKDQSAEVDARVDGRVAPRPGDGRGEKDRETRASASDLDWLTRTGLDLLSLSSGGEIIDYAGKHDADLVATGTRGRHGEHSFLLGSVAEAIVRRCPVPVLTVRQLDTEETAPDPPS